MLRSTPALRRAVLPPPALRLPAHVSRQEDGDGGRQVLSKPGLKAIGIAAVMRSGLLNTDLEI